MVDLYSNQLILESSQMYSVQVKYSQTNKIIHDNTERQSQVVQTHIVQRMYVRHIMQT